MRTGKPHAAPWLHAGWLFGLLPSRGMSFEYHLFGALCGVLFAALEQRLASRREEP